MAQTIDALLGAHVFANVQIYLSKKQYRGAYRWLVAEGEGQRKCTGRCKESKLTPFTPPPLRLNFCWWDHFTYGWRGCVVVGDDKCKFFVNLWQIFINAKSIRELHSRDCLKWYLQSDITRWRLPLSRAGWIFAIYGTHNAWCLFILCRKQWNEKAQPRSSTTTRSIAKVFGLEVLLIKQRLKLISCMQLRVFRGEKIARLRTKVKPFVLTR